MSGQTVKGAVERRAPQQISLVEHVRQNLWPEMQRVLPTHLTGDRMMRLALTVLRKTPKLTECDPASYVGALLSADALGLDPGVDDEAYLAPFGRECTLIVGYQGYVKLFWQHPLAQHIDAQAVYEGDEFEYAYGTNPYLNHVPGTNRGKITHYYAVGALSSGGRHFVVLTPEECKQLRQGKVGPDPKFKGGDPLHWMERKTALRQLFKLLPKSREMSAALAVDDRTGRDLAAHKVPQAIAQRGELSIDPIDEPPLGIVPPTTPPPPSQQQTGAPEPTTNQVEKEEPTVKPATQPVSKKAKLTAIDNAFTSIGWTINADQIRAASIIAGTEIAKLADLTDLQADALMTALADVAADPDPQTRLTDLLAEIRGNNAS